MAVRQLAARALAPLIPPERAAVVGACTRCELHHGVFRKSNTDAVWMQRRFCLHGISNVPNINLVQGAFQTQTFTSMLPYRLCFAGVDLTQEAKYLAIELIDQVKMLLLPT